MSRKPANKKKKGQPVGAGNRILSDHHREGSHYIPPLMHLGAETSSSYSHDILPELVWIELLNRKWGAIRVARFLENLFRVIANLASDKVAEHNFALISSYTLLSEAHKEELRDALERMDVLPDVQNLLAPLVLLYDDCPLVFFGPPSELYTRDAMIQSLRSCITDTFDRESTPAVVLQASMLIYKLTLGQLHIADRSMLPDLNSIVDAPDSDEARLAGATIRAMTLGFFAHSRPKEDWARHFWNRNIELSPCDFG